jgi:RecA-family ATPase
MNARVLPTFKAWDLRGQLEDMGYSEERIEARLAEAKAMGQIIPEPSDELGTITLHAMRSPPVERFLLGRMVPLAKTTVLYGPTGAGKSAALAQLAFAVSSGARSLWGLTVGVRGRVLVVTAEDSLDDWVRKAAAVDHGTEADVEAALENFRVLDLTEGVARLTEEVFVHEDDGNRREHRPTDLAERIIDHAIRRDAVLVVVETASRFVEDEDNASFSAFQSALGRIARETGAAVIVSHHITKPRARATPPSRQRGAAVRSSRTHATPSVWRPRTRSWPASFPTASPPRTCSN